MARFRKIDVRIWCDERFMRMSSAQPNGQTLWFYLLTNPETTNIPGLYRAGEAGMAEALGWSLEGFREAFAEAFREGLVKADWKARLVWIPNAIRHNPPENPNVIKSWRVAWDELPECSLKHEARRALKAFVEGLSEGFRKAFAEALPEEYGESGAGAGAGAITTTAAQVAEATAAPGEQQAASPKPQKPARQRAPSTQERLAERLRAIRAEQHPEWPGDLQILAQPALNLQLAKVVKAAGGEDGAVELWRHYLADPWAQKRDPPCPLAAFLADGVWSKYLGRSSPAARPRCCVPGCTAEAEERLGLWRGNGCREHFEAWNAERKRAFDAGSDLGQRFEAWLQAQLPRQEVAQA